jgi:hypothetical protein
MTIPQITVKETTMAIVLILITEIEIGVEIGIEVAVLIGLDHVPQLFHLIEIIVMIALILLDQIMVVFVTDLAVLIEILIIDHTIQETDLLTLHTVEAIA